MPQNKKKALEIGCGSNDRVIKELLKSDFTVSAIDASLKMISLIQQKQKNVNFIHTAFEDWEVSESFDIIIAWDSICHAEKSMQGPIVRKMCRLLDKNGILLFTAGGIEEEISDKMNGVSFNFASLNYSEYLRIIEEMKCRFILIERDQDTFDHMVFICKKSVVTGLPARDCPFGSVAGFKDCFR